MKLYGKRHPFHFILSTPTCIPTLSSAIKRAKKPSQVAGEKNRQLESLLKQPHFQHPHPHQHLYPNSSTPNSPTHNPSSSIQNSVCGSIGIQAIRV